MATASDTFTEASNVNLTSHTADTGQSWTFGFSSYGNVTVAAATDNINATDGYGSLHYSSIVPATAEYDVTLDCFVAGSGDRSTGPAGRLATGADDGYHVYWRGSDGEWKLVKVVAGTQTVLATHWTTDVPTTTRTVKLEIRDATKKVYFGGTERMSSTDNAVTATGRPGLLGGGQTTSTGDNWAFADVAGGGGTAVPVFYKHMQTQGMA